MNEQLSLFEKPKFHIGDRRIKLIELFAGIGAQAKAFERLEARGLLPNGFDHHRVCELDKFAVASYNAVHGTGFETSDITKWHAEDLGITDTDKYTYVVFYSFPCTDISQAGRMQGYSRGSNTRSGLLWEVERLINELDASPIYELPQVLIMENVAGVASKKNHEPWMEWLGFLKSKGYNSFANLMNAKDYGIPQNRKRMFMVSVLGDYSYEFPKPFKLQRRLCDVLDCGVEEKFYLSKKVNSNLVEQMHKAGSEMLEI